MNIVVVGCGQIGGSLLLRARERFPNARTWVVEQEEARQAIEASGACDHFHTPEALGLALSEANIVCLATPLHLAAASLRQILDGIRADASVFDVMSLKRVMHKAADGHVREERFVGGHPMFGSEGSGFSSANPAWLDDAPFILTRAAKTSTDAYVRVVDFVQQLGARVQERTPEAHDQELGVASHLPQALSSVLMALADETPEALLVHGPGFRDMTRLALSAPGFWSEVFSHNADVLRPLIARYADLLTAFAADFSPALLDRAQDAKRRVARLEQGTLASRVSESSTGAMLRRVNALVESGKEVIGLHVGEPKLAVSPEVRALVAQALANAPIAYTPTLGSSALRARVARVASRVLGREVEAEHTIVTVGAKQALHLALASLLAPGDEVIILTPAWVSFAETVRLAGGKPVFVSSLEAAVPTARTRAVILNSPNNPTGEVYGRAALEPLLARCRAHGVWLISDELYRCFVHDGAHVSPAALYDEERTVWLDGIAKSHAMTGLRIGYAVAPRALIGKMAKLASHETSCAPSPSQAAAVALLDAFPDGDPALLKEVRALREIVRAWGDETTAALGLPRPLIPGAMAGGFYAWLDLGAVSPALSSRRVCDELLESVGVSTMFGEAFLAPGYLRIAYALERAQLEKALVCVRVVLSHALT